MTLPTAPKRHVVSNFDFPEPILRLPPLPARIFWTILPGVTGVTQGRNQSHITFHVKELPRRPWPVTIDDVPFTMHSSENRAGYNNQPLGRSHLFPITTSKLGSSSISICSRFDGTKALSDDDLRLITCDIVQDLSDRVPEIDVVEVIHASDAMFYIVLNNKIKANFPSIQSRLPGFIGSCVAGYCFEKDFEWPSRQANGPGFIPMEQRPRFGMVSTMSPGSTWTTSGVVLKNTEGQHFVTAAAHAIGKEDSPVYMAMCTGRTQFIGTVAEAPFADVALVRISGGAQSASRVLHATETDRFLPAAVLLGEDPEEQPGWNHLVTFRSPAAGGLDGVIVAKSARPNVEPLNTEEPLQCVVYQWAFVGQVEDGGDDDMAPRPGVGTPGAAVVDRTGLCIGLFDHYISQGPWAGFAVMLSATELVKAGYKLG